MVIVAGTPGSGKTAVLIHALRNLKQRSLNSAVVKIDCLFTDDGKKFEEYARDAYDGAYLDRKNYTRNPQSKYNPYSILLDISEARGDYKTSLNLLNELPQNDPSVVLKKDRINSILKGNPTEQK